MTVTYFASTTKKGRILIRPNKLFSESLSFCVLLLSSILKIS